MQRKLVLAWAYVRRELVFLSWMLMEVALMTPLSLAVLPWADEWWGRGRLFVGLLLLMLAGFYLARFLYWLKLPATDQRNLLVGSGLVLIFLIVRSLNYQPVSALDFSWIGQSLRNLAIAGSNLWLRDLFLIVLVALSWWRGLALLNREIDVVRVGKRFRIGGLYVAPIVILLASLRLNWSVLPFLLFFFAVSLTAVALTRAESTEKAQMAILSSLSPRWFGLVISLSVITTFLAGATAVLLSGSSEYALGRWLAPLWNALRWGGSVIGLTASYIVAPLLNSLEAFFQFLIRVFQKGFAILFEPNPDAQESPANAGDLMEGFNRWIINQEQGGPGLFSNVNWRLVIIGALLLIALFILVQFYRKKLLVPGNGRFGKILADASGRLTPNRIRRKKTNDKKGHWRDWRTAVSIIRIYQQMVQISSDIGHPRGHSETPYEYLQTLATIWPAHLPDLRLITRAYVKVRYGEFPETREEFEAIKAAWERVRKTAVATAD